MKIVRIEALPGVGAGYVTDLLAVREGATTDAIGLLYAGRPRTPGFTAIRQPAATVLIVLVLEDGRIAYGDCATTVFPGRPGRSAPIEPGEIIRIIHEHVVPRLVGRDVEAFRPNDEFVAGIRIAGGPLGPAARYGLSQALLDAAAKAQGTVMAAVLAAEWGLEPPSQRIALNLQTGPDWQRGIDKIIVRRGDIIHSRNPHNEAMLDDVPEFLGYVRDRLQRLAPAEYQPRIHLDFYGLVGKRCDRDASQMVEYIARLESIVAPYALLVGDPVEMASRSEQIEVMSSIRNGARDAGLAARLVAEEHCLTMDDHVAFLTAGAADYVKVRPLDLGNIGHAMDIASILLAERSRSGVGFYLTGSGAETEHSARTRVHVALATRADFMLASPGMGVDEAHSLAVNEMTRAMAMV